MPRRNILTQAVDVLVGLALGVALIAVTSVMAITLWRIAQIVWGL